jgi:hypothetical protein
MFLLRQYVVASILHYESHDHEDTDHFYNIMIKHLKGTSSFSAYSLFCSLVCLIKHKGP